MQQYVGPVTIVLLLGMVLTRVILMRRQGITVVYFGKIDRKDFLIPPFAFFYFYVVFAAAFDLPAVSRQIFFRSQPASWIGASLCLVGLIVLFLSLISFGRSFRIGIDAVRPDQLATTGVFAWSRNPMYLAFGLVLLGQFLLFPDYILLAYLLAGAWLFHRQVLREEAYLRTHYGQQYMEYCARVRRYL